jgi:hypothetical protein
MKLSQEMTRETGVYRTIVNRVQLQQRRGEAKMSSYTKDNIHTGMHVYSSDDHDVGHVAAVYPDSFEIHKGFFFPTDRYIPYSAVAFVENDRVVLTMPADVIKDKEWTKRPDYEDHLGDPLQLLYDQGHGVTDPFNEEPQNPDRP